MRKNNSEPAWYKPLFLAFVILLGVGATISTIYLSQRGENVSLNITIIFTFFLLFLPRLFFEKPLRFYGLELKNFRKSISLKPLSLLLLFLIIFLGINIGSNYFAPKVSQLARQPEVPQVHSGTATAKAIAPLPLGLFLLFEFIIVLTDILAEELLFRGIIEGGLLKIREKILTFTPYNPKNSGPQVRDEGNFKYLLKIKDKEKPRSLGRGYTGFTFRLKPLVKRWSPWIIILFQGIIFAIVHWKIFIPLGARFIPLSLYSGIYALLFGLVAGWLFWKEKSILPAFFLHFGINFFSVVLTRI